MIEWASDELSVVLSKLTPQQARGVVRIVQAELEGRALSSLLDRPGQICTSTTFYGSGKSRGWRNKPAFQRALDLARRDYRGWALENGAGKALGVLAGTAPDAALSLRQRVVGDEPALTVLETTLLTAPDEGLRASAARQLGGTGLPRVVEPLRRALGQETAGEVQQAIVEALGMVAAGAGRDGGATAEVLDRADLRTASKSQQAVTGAGGGPLAVGVLAAVAELSDEEVERMLENLMLVEGTPIGGGGQMKQGA